MGAQPVSRVGSSFRRDLFDRPTVEALAERLVRLLDQVAADPGVRVSQVDVLSPAERRQVLGGLERHRDSGAGGGTGELLAAQAARTPDATAVVSGDVAWSYRGAGRGGEPGRLGAARRAGVAAGSAWAVAMSRSAELVAAVLAAC